ncbi:FecR domain-containing protein [Porifericola rhodea]|uniref:FecR family protein n=1 Tax=Porifericola rhodea TaxID=930972 RepID=UPI002666BAA1|nr:FecR domain-containing protein [Porifericola rhodea]WKN31447.1 FecR domain-containing protein [Porifericola rhodea]
MKASYTLYDLLEDDSFQQYARQQDEDAYQQWKSWLEIHPEQKALAEEARQMIVGVKFKKQSLAPEVVDDAWESLNRKIDHQGGSKWGSIISFYHGLAATVSLLIVAMAAWWVLEASYHMRLQTDYGQTSSFVLPDGSEVTLNANSLLSYDIRNLQSAERQVMLSGEAFFHVIERSIQGDRHTFSVHTEEGGRVEVLGTSFNVHSRRNKTQVVLESGKVRFKTAQDATLLQPGEMVEYSETTRQVSKKTVQAEKFSAWKEQMLYFDDSPLTELAHLLEDNYGLQVVFHQQQLEGRKISGGVSARNLDVLLQALERLLQIDIKRDHDKLHFYSADA